MTLNELRNRVLDILDDDQGAIPREYRTMLVQMIAAKYLEVNK